MAAGNNKKSLKIYKLKVPLLRDNELGADIYGRYYLPETPELENKDIVGIQANFGDNDITITSGDSYYGKPAFNLGNWTAIVKAFFVTLYNKDNEETIYNLPLTILFNPNSSTYRTAGKILPVNMKLNVRKSFIFTPIVTTGSVNNVAYINLTFFYN